MKPKLLPVQENYNLVRHIQRSPFQYTRLFKINREFQRELEKLRRDVLIRKKFLSNHTKI